MPVLEKASATLNRTINPITAQCCANRHVTTAQSFGDRHDIGNNPLLLACEKGACAPHAAHHLIKDQKYTITVAYFTDTLEVPFNRRHRSECCADDWLSDEGHDRFRTKTQNFSFQFISNTRAVV